MYVDWGNLLILLGGVTIICCLHYKNSKQKHKDELVPFGLYNILSLYILLMIIKDSIR